MAEKQQERSEQAQYWPVTGVVAACVITDVTGAVLYNENAAFDTPVGLISFNALSFIHDYFDGDFTPNSSNDECGALLFGLNIRERMRVMAIDALNYMHMTGVDRPIAPRSWYSATFEHGITCDPTETIGPSEIRKNIPYDTLCNFFGIVVPDQADTRPDIQASMARELALKLKLTACLPTSPLPPSRS